MHTIAATLVLIGALIAGAGAQPAAATQVPAALAISYFPHGSAGSARHWRLTCRPPGGTHPHARAACAELAAHRGALGPVRRACPFLVRRGAPQALVLGRIGRRHVDRVVRPVCDGGAWRYLHVLLTGS